MKFNCHTFDFLSEYQPKDNKELNKVCKGEIFYNFWKEGSKQVNYPNYTNASYNIINLQELSKIYKTYDLENDKFCLASSHKKRRYKAQSLNRKEILIRNVKNAFHKHASREPTFKLIPWHISAPSALFDQLKSSATNNYGLELELKLKSKLIHKRPITANCPRKISNYRYGKKLKNHVMASSNLSPEIEKECAHLLKIKKAI